MPTRSVLFPLLRFPQISVVLACTVPLAGCVRFTRQPLSPERTAAAFDARRFPTKRGRWSLARLTAEALEKHPDLAVLRARVQTAEGALRTAGERPNPVLAFRPLYNSTTQIISPWIIESAIDITIETGGKRDARMAEAVARIRVARLDWAAAAWKVRSDVRRALLALYAAEATRAQYGAQVAAQGEAARLVESQLADGAARPQDVAAARIPLHQTRLAIHDTELLAVRSRHQLATAVGVPVVALAGVEFDFAEVSRLAEPPAGGVARRHAVTHRPDILSALSDYAATEERVRLEVARQFPDLKLGPGYNLDRAFNLWKLGIGYELPILHQRQGAIAEAEGRRAEAAARFRALQARALGEIDLALASYRAARAKADAADALATDVAKQTRIAEEMKAAGELSQLDVSQRRVEQGVSDLGRAQARLQALDGLGALEDALQTPASAWQ